MKRGAGGSDAVNERIRDLKQRIAELEQQLKRMTQYYEQQVLQTTSLDKQCMKLEAELEKGYE
jgi:chromosome segregation ATPase